MKCSKRFRYHVKQYRPLPSSTVDNIFIGHFNKSNVTKWRAFKKYSVCQADLEILEYLVKVRVRIFYIPSIFAFKFGALMNYELTSHGMNWIAFQSHLSHLCLSYPSEVQNSIYDLNSRSLSMLAGMNA